jgi:hypothetical protein
MRLVVSVRKPALYPRCLDYTPYPLFLCIHTVVRQRKGHLFLTAVDESIVKIYLSSASLSFGAACPAACLSCGSKLAPSHTPLRMFPS